MPSSIPDVLPVIPTMDIVVFPHMLVPLLVLDEKIIQGINGALQDSKLVLLLAARGEVDGQGAIGTKDLYQVGTVASIMRLIRLPEGGVKVLVQGIAKARAVNIVAENESLYASIQQVQMPPVKNQEEVTAQIRNIKDLAEKISVNGQLFSPDFHMILSKMQDPEKIADFILSHLSINVEESQQLLEASTLQEFLSGIYLQLSKEIEVGEMQEKIKNSARDSMNKSQKEFYLREQLRAIKKELGDEDEEEIEKLKDQLDLLQVSDDIKKEVKRNISRLERTSPDSMEASVIRTYLEWIFALPWGKKTTDNLDLAHAKQVLDEDHYGLADIKERILDFISVRNLKAEDGFAPILCFVGPPGTGKTSLGKSIAKSLGRKYARISLGGVKDEAEIRGHRRTYVGALPGRFIQALKKANSLNPVIIIDELDKIGSDFRGDPSAAMLEVLDPQQNVTFYDNYLGIPFDLSKVMFIATANSVDTISAPLRDRMEIIELSGYTLEEKINIAKQHLVQRAISDAGLDGQAVKFNDAILAHLIMSYTKESGVRQCERVIQKLCSKIARSFVETKKIEPIAIKSVEKYLGPRKYASDAALQRDQVGITNALAWTSYGGEMLKIEAIMMPGTGKLILTGQLGDVMKESAQAAMSYARAHAKEFNIANSVFTQNDFHIHIPAGAIPKDGPSAGITMLTSILSALTNRPINGQYAMTGELNLRGEIMPIGGVKEKILAAKRNKVSHVILPSQNKNDLINMEDIAKGITLVWADHADDVIKQVLSAVVVVDKKHKARI